MLPAAVGWTAVTVMATAATFVLGTRVRPVRPTASVAPEATTPLRAPRPERVSTERVGATVLIVPPALRPPPST